MKKANQPKPAYIQTASGVKTYNIHMYWQKTSAFVVNWPSGPAAQQPSGQAASNSITTIPIPVQHRRATEKALGTKIL